MSPSAKAPKQSSPLPSQRVGISLRSQPVSAASGSSGFGRSRFACPLPALLSRGRGISLLRCLMCARQLLSCEELKQSPAQKDLMDEQ